MICMGDRSRGSKVGERTAILGWDIGGVNTKAARLAADSQAPHCTLSRPYEVQRDRSQLAPTLRAVAAQLGARETDHHAVTMTAELSQSFRTKREGVGFILHALEEAFPACRIHVYTVAGRFVTTQEARARPLEAAASNWAATAAWVARQIPDCILVDIGTTTTDLIPIEQGTVVARGRTDPERLASGELIYSGALRTPFEALTWRVPFDGATAGVSAEGFALSGDVYLWLGRVAEEDYTCPTPDGRPATREYAGERLARVVCADREMLDEDTIDRIAQAVAQAQLGRITAALREVRSRFLTLDTAVVTGLGEFIAAEAARDVGLRVIRLGDTVDGAGQTAAATAVACLLRDAFAAQ
jgi:(4-(4-[2-(gamma-L-glutamylamino)ethyl]phenoxymethyl)furan-2-yl)methanamine synthase